MNQEKNPAAAAEAREQLRRRVLVARDALSPEARRSKSAAVHAHLAQLAEVGRARLILVYLHFRSEVETLPALAAALPPACRLAVPLTLVGEKRLAIYQLTAPEYQLRSGYCGIPEPDPARCLPLDPAELDLVLLPGTVFDPRGGRLGYGGGYYDRFLVREAPQAIRVGLAFQLQLVDHLPLLPHDQPLHHLVTETGLIL